MQKHLIAVQGPLQLISACIANEWLCKVENINNYSCTLLVYDLASSADGDYELYETIKLLSSVRVWDDIVFITSNDMSGYSELPFKDAKESLKKILKQEKFDHIYLARDFIGLGSPLIINTYNNARKITYGDGFGEVGYESDYSLNIEDCGYLRFINFKVKTFLKAFFQKGPKKYKFSDAILILPILEKLYKINLFIPSHDFVMNEINKFCEKVEGIEDYSSSILDGSEDTYLLLLSNFYPSGLMSLKNELQLYLEIVSNQIPTGSKIVIKQHPRGDFNLSKALEESLKLTYKVKIIPLSIYARIPLELWQRLIKQCIIVPVFSSSAYNLKYLYKTNLINSLSDSLITKYFYSNKIDFAIKGNDRINKAITALDYWDGQSPLLVSKP